MNVDVQIVSNAAGIPSADDIGQWVKRAVSTVAADSDAEVSVRIVDEDEMQTLNRDYRDQDKPTNVLSFPTGDADGMPPGVTSPLGDIVVCAAVVAREAEEQGKTLDEHWSHMLVHGALHLLGHDHLTESQADAMESLEREILAGLGIADPYQGN